MQDQHVSQARSVCYELSISINATSEQVWKAITTQLNSWWLPSFHMLGENSIVNLEPKAGGRLFEQEGQRELLWYTVLAIEPEQSLSLAGYCSPEYGGPSTTMLTMKLVTDGKSTILNVTDALFGHIPEGQVKSLHSGWTQLFRDGLKAFLEK